MDFSRMSQGERIAGAGGVALFGFWLIVFDFPAGESRGIGILLSLVAAAAIAYGGYIAARGRRGRF